MPDINGGTPMNLPVGITTVTINGRLLNSDGTPCVGAIEFTPSTAVAYTGSDVTLLPKMTSVDLDAEGRFSFTTGATDDPAGNPGVHRTVGVNEKMAGGRYRLLELPMEPAVKDYADLIAVSFDGGVPTVPVVTYITISSANGGTP